jgi:hypothetical protein
VTPESSINPSKVSLATFAFYYTWYGTPQITGYWNHWNASQTLDTTTSDRRDVAATDYPLGGLYDSNNETLIAQQIQLAKRAGVDCFVISWWGVNDFTDNATKHVVKVCEQENLKFAFYYETTSSINQSSSDLAYLLKTYSNSPAFFKIDQNPVIFIYSRARDDLSPQGWLWHACTNIAGNDQDPSAVSNAATSWMPAEEIRSNPRLGIIPFQPFKTSPGYIENSNPINLPANGQYLLNVGVSDIRNDSGENSEVGIKIRIGQNSSCSETLVDRVLKFEDGWQDWSFNITNYAGHEVYIKAESYSTNWQSAWAAVDYFYVNDSAGVILNSDPFFDNGWQETVQNLRKNGLNPYLVMDFGGYEGNLKSFMDYFQSFIDGIHMYNPTGFLKLNNAFNFLTGYSNVTSGNTNGTISSAAFPSISVLYSYASQLAHAQGKGFIATVVPGFNNTITPLLTVNRQDGNLYRAFWQSAINSNPDGYVVTSFNEWHEGTEIEPSLEYGDQYINETSTLQQAAAQTPIQTVIPSKTQDWTVIEVSVVVAVAIAGVLGAARFLGKRRAKRKSLG